MINCREVRIGNFVQFDNLPYMIGMDTFTRVNFNKVNPIPLTEEIFLKCGFERIGIWLGISFNPRMSIRFYNGNSAECDIVQDGKFISFKCGHIKYVHQLQNLYFSLTGKELEINL